MKSLIILAIVSVSFLSANANPLSIIAEKWELYKLVNQLSDELDNNSHTKDQVNLASSYLKSAMDALKNVPTEPKINLTLLSPATSPGNDATPTVRVSGGIEGVRSVSLYSDSACTDLVGQGFVSGATMDITAKFNNDGSSDGTYNFHISTTSRSGQGGIVCSKEFVEYTLDTISPDTPADIFVPSYHYELTTSPTITFDRSSATDVSYYEMSISSSPAGGNDVAADEIVSNDRTYYQFTGLSLVPYVYYYVSVRAVDKAGNYSMQKTATNGFMVVQ